MKFAWRIVSLLVGAVFVFAGISKIVDFQPFRFLDPMAFARDIDNYKILPWGISVLLALYLPWLEVICGLALVFRRLYSGALALLLALLVVFIGASFAAKARGIDITCGCFGHVSDQLSFAWHMALDFAIVAGVAALWRWDSEIPPYQSKSVVRLFPRRVASCAPKRFGGGAPPRMSPGRASV